MKKFFCFCMFLLISVFVNSLCIGMETVGHKCNHLITSEKSYTMTNYSDEKPQHSSVLCSQCAKAELIKKLKKWMNLDKNPFYYCGLLRPEDGIKIKYCEPKNGVPGHYKVTPDKRVYLPGTNIKGEVCPEGEEKLLAKYCYITLDNTVSEEEKEAKVYACKNPNCRRFNDMLSIAKGRWETLNINYNSGHNYAEVRECEREGHVKLDYSIKIN